MGKDELERTSNEIKEFRDIIKKQADELSIEIKEMEHNEMVKKYLDLCLAKKLLDDNLVDLDNGINEIDMKTCDHIWVINGLSNRDDDMYIRGCVKCGLDTSKLSDELYDLYAGSNLKGIKLNVICNLKKGMEAYSKLKSNNPYIDDELASKCLKKQLNNNNNKK